MELIKKHYQKIISCVIIALGVIAFLVTLFLHLKISFYWCSFFFIIVGLTLLLLAEDKK